MGVLRNRSHRRHEPSQEILCDHVPRARRRDADQRSDRRGHSGDRILFLYADAPALAHSTQDLSDSGRAAIFYGRVALVSPSRRTQHRLSRLLRLVGAFWTVCHRKFRPLGALVLFYFGWTRRFFSVDVAAAIRGER